MIDFKASRLTNVIEMEIISYFHNFWCRFWCDSGTFKGKSRRVVGNDHGNIFSGILSADKKVNEMIETTSKETAPPYVSDKNRSFEHVMEL